ncbi:transposase [Streptomyces sp. NPDC005017]|uniref:transposase n=1 Tax=Streptomyces sp. NPDC005017 TaxID=3364706 RepID=UPI003686FD5C
MLDDREADTTAAWLRDHPGIEIICRDRAGAYASAAQAAAPDAVQVADRFHVWKNLCENVEKGVASHRSCLVSSAGEPEPAPDPATDMVLPEGARAAAVRQRYVDVHALWDKGVGIGRIADRLGLDRKTVRRYAHADTVEHMLITPRLGGRALVRYVAYLNQRWSEGCTDSGRLFRELQQLGYTGSSRSVRRWLEPLRTLDGPPGRLPEAPTVRQVATWLTRHPDSLRSDESLGLKRVLDHCPELADTAAHVREFSKIMDRLDGARRLPGWIDRAEDAALPMIRSFARNLRNDLPAVIQSFSTPWNSGIVEGRVTDIKAIKRQMAGRVGFRLLRKRTLLVASSRRPPRVTNTTTS